MTWNNVYKPVKRAIKTNESTRLPSLPPWKGLKLKRETSNNAGTSRNIITLSVLWNDFYYREETNLEQTMRFHPGKTVSWTYHVFNYTYKTCHFCSLFFFCHSELCKLSYVFVFLSSILSLDNDVSDIKTWCKALFAISKLWNFEKNKRCRKLNPASAKWSF